MFFLQRLAMAQDIIGKELFTEKNSNEFWDVLGRALRKNSKGVLGCVRASFESGAEGLLDDPRGIGA
jgi:hypothetical protein